MRWTARSSFVVRVARDGHGRFTGVVERVATGAEEPFSGVETIGGEIDRMTRRMSTTSRAAPHEPRSAASTSVQGGKANDPQGTADHDGGAS